MNYADWLDRFQKLAAELGARQGFDVRLELAPGADETELEMTELQAARRAGVEEFRIPSPLREFSAVTTVFNFRWLWEDPPAPHETLVGMFNIASAGELFDPLPDEDQYVEEDLGEGFSFYGQFRTFDDLGPDAHALARFTRGRGEPELFWHTVDDDGGERLTPLPLTFDEYLECALAACCLFPWQELFVEDPASGAADEFFSLLDLLAPLGDRALLERVRDEVKKRR